MGNHVHGTILVVKKLDVRQAVADVVFGNLDLVQTHSWIQPEWRGWVELNTFTVGKPPSEWHIRRGHWASRRVDAGPQQATNCQQ